MIIEYLLTALYNVFDMLMVFEIPDMPSQAMSYVNQFFGYLETGAGVLANYTPFAYLLTLFFVLVAVDAGILIYHFVMWIVRKIPMAGIS